MGEFALGQPVPRFEDPRLLRGGGRYVDDLAPDNLLHAVILRSSVAHGRTPGDPGARTGATDGGGGAGQA